MTLNDDLALDIGVDADWQIDVELDLESGDVSVDLTNFDIAWTEWRY